MGMLQFNPVHLAYGVMVIGIIFTFVLSRRTGKDLRVVADEFVFHYVKLSNFISPSVPKSGFAFEELEDGKIRILPPEQQSGAIRGIIQRAGDPVTVERYKKLLAASEEMDAAAGFNRTNKRQFSEPLSEILNNAYVFLTGCENLEGVDTIEKKEEMEKFLFNQVDFRMTMLRRISGARAEEYRQLNSAYTAEMEAAEKKYYEDMKKGKR